MQNMFQGCTALENVPVYDTSKAYDSSILMAFRYAFKDCPNLTDISLNNIMEMCINATRYTGTKTLSHLGLTSEQATRCESLSNYTSFVNAGWSKGY